MSPRRWTLRGGLAVDRYGEPPLEQHEQVPVREDVINEEDVEAVASELVLIDKCNPNDVPFDQWGHITGVYRDKAIRVLALVLGSGKEGEDA